jgi:hypothetical protein
VLLTTSVVRIVLSRLHADDSVLTMDGYSAKKMRSALSPSSGRGHRHGP